MVMRSLSPFLNVFSLVERAYSPRGVLFSRDRSLISSI